MIGLCLCCLVMMFSLQLIGVYLGALFYYGQAEALDVATLILLGSNNGMVVAISIGITAALFTLFAFGVAYIKSRKSTQADSNTPLTPSKSSDKAWQSIWRFFGIKSIDGKGFIVSLTGMLVFMVLSELIFVNLDISPMDFLQGLIDEKSLVPLLIAIVIVAPVYEELIFRGLIFGALYHRHDVVTPIHLFSSFRTDVRTLTASVISSILFTLVHLQYDLIGMMVIFFMALFFTFIRIKYGLIMAILMHIINNGVAMAFYLMQQFTS